MMKNNFLPHFIVFYLDLLVESIYFFFDQLILLAIVEGLVVELVLYVMHFIINLLDLLIFSLKFFLKRGNFLLHSFMLFFVWRNVSKFFFIFVNDLLHVLNLLLVLLYLLLQLIIHLTLHEIL